MTSSNQKLVDCLIQNQSSNFLKSDIWTILLQNWLKSQFSRIFKHWLWTVQSTNFGFEDAKRNLIIGFTIFLNIFYQNNPFRGTVDLVTFKAFWLWMHNFDAICNRFLHGKQISLVLYFLMRLSWYRSLLEKLIIWIIWQTCHISTFTRPFSLISMEKGMKSAIFCS